MVTYKKQKIIGIIDTGSSISLIQSQFVEKSEIDTNQKTHLQVFNGELHTTLGTIKGNFNLGETNINIKRLHVVKKCQFDFIIGLDAIKSLELKTVNDQLRVKLNGCYVNLVFQKERVLTLNSVEIPPFCVRKVDVDIQGTAFSGDIEISSVPISHPNFRSLQVIDSVCSRSKPEILLVNNSSAPLFLPPKLMVGIAKNFESQNGLFEVPDHEAENLRHDTFMRNRSKKFTPILNPKVQLGDDLTGPERCAINTVLRKNHQSFAYDKRDVGLVRNFRYSVPLIENAKNWYEPERKVAPAKRAEITKIFDAEVEDGLLKKAASEYSHG